jgi:glutathione S-transferase
VFGDYERIRPHNPLLRVPVLVLDDGEALIDSHIILDHLDSLVAPEAALFPRAEPARRRALKVATLAAGLAEKGVSLFYEQRFHDLASERWTARCRDQIGGALAALEADRAARPTPYWFGEAIGHADIAAAVVWRFLGEALPGAFDPAAHPALAAHAARCEALPAFAAISQPFRPSA